MMRRKTQKKSIRKRRNTELPAGMSDYYYAPETPKERQKRREREERERKAKEKQKKEVLLAGAFFNNESIRLLIESLAGEGITPQYMNKLIAYAEKEYTRFDQVLDNGYYMGGSGWEIYQPDDEVSAVWEIEKFTAHPSWLGRSFDAKILQQFVIDPPQNECTPEVLDCAFEIGKQQDGDAAGGGGLVRQHFQIDWNKMQKYIENPKTWEKFASAMNKNSEALLGKFSIKDSVYIVQYPRPEE